VNDVMGFVVVYMIYSIQFPVSISKKPEKNVDISILRINAVSIKNGSDTSDFRMYVGAMTVWRVVRS
jgi:hypothetical protein